MFQFTKFLFYIIVIFVHVFVDVVKYVIPNCVPYAAPFLGYFKVHQVKFLIKLIFFLVQELDFIFYPDGANFLLCDVGGLGSSRNFYVSIIWNYVSSQALSVKKYVGVAF